MSASTRRFLGFDRPFLEHAVELLLERAPNSFDFSKTLVVLPGGRAKRRFEESFAEGAPPIAAPPRAITIGELAPALSKVELKLASQLESAALWRAALIAAPRREVARLWNVELGGAVPWTELGRRVQRSLSQLWAEGWVAADVEAHLAGSAGEFDRERWRAIASIEASYRDLLEQRGLVDRDLAAIAVRERNGFCDDVEVVLVGLVDLDRARRRLLEPIAARVTAFVCADPTESHEFDAFGALDHARFEDRDLELDDANWKIADGPDDAAKLALDALESFAPNCGAHEITIGVLDDALVPFVAREFDEVGLEARWAGGRSLARSRPIRLLAAIFEFLAGRSFESFAALVRHPDLETRWASELPDAASSVDEYAGRHLPTTAERSAVIADAHDRSDVECAARFARLIELVDEALAALAGDGNRTPRAWAEAIARTLDAIYRREFTLGAASELADEFERIRGVLEEFAALDDANELDRGAAAELLLARARELESPPRLDRERTSIELLGWLELALDDAPNLVLVGVDEGSLPSPGAADAFLPEVLRRELGLGHEARRVARDTWLLSMLARSRRELVLISTRRSAARDPRTPSRLLFRADGDTVVRRVRRFFGRDEEKKPAALGATERYVPPLRKVSTPTSMRVTDFRRYLESPYGYYLERVLALESIDDRAVELDPLNFGSLVHEVLEQFGRHRLASSTDVEDVREFLRSTLAARARARFGDRARPAVRLQLANLEYRLDRFAEWQVARSASGWRIVEVELERTLALEVDGRAMPITGRIDRLDRNEVAQKWAIIDYKSGDKGDEPESTHRKGPRGSKRWVDLQLPLYREMLRAKTGGDSVELAFVRIAGGVATDELMSSAVWTEQELETAIDVAKEVVRKIRRAEFGEVGDDAPREPILAAIAGFGLTESEGDDEDDDA